MATMGIELELAVLLGVLVLGTATFAPFEVETPIWRKILKWSVVIGATLALYGPLGHWTLALPLGLGAVGVTFHFAWCAKHGIHPLRATPRRKYYGLRGWEWRD